MTSLLPGTDPSTIPVFPPPPGTTSNFVNPEPLANTWLYVGTIMLVFTALVVAVRLLSNYHTTRGLGWDDCSCVTATAFFLVYVVTTLENRVFARHGYDIPLAWVTPSALKKSLVQAFISALMLLFAKSSLFMLYYRLFGIEKLIRYTVVFSIIFSAIFYSCVMIADAALCAPKVGHAWQLMVQVRCGERGLVLGLIFGIVNLALDVCLLVLPIPVIVAMQLSVQKKVGVLTIFMVGSFGLAASTIAMAYRIKLWQSRNSEFSGPIVVLCTIIEAGVTILCSCTSALAALWQSHLATNVTRLYSRLCSLYSTRFKSGSPEPDQPKPKPQPHRSLCDVDLSDRSAGSSSDSIEIVGNSPISSAERGEILKVEQ